ncbi:histone chaperone asf1b-B-like [Pomacea canaliculata]|uniref:histone chaperone asf1b-B-like n=1 Tax=Pomacea canaliculata TaxID=400727 RepID=UPI000D73D724|nr:histone chaperone asf1b-B-like [Pomacea canaliculata]
MALVNICNVTVLNNPSPFLRPFQFEITFECAEDLPQDLEWKIIYVGSAESMECDQILDTILVGPVPGGSHMFMFEAGPPDTSSIPVADVLGVTVVLLTCSYQGQEFIRVGYFVNNEYEDPEFKENPPAVPLFDKITRNILAEKPRVTRFNIQWHSEQVQQQQQQSHDMEDFNDLENIEPGMNTESVSNLMENSLAMPVLGSKTEESVDSLEKMCSFVPE